MKHLSRILSGLIALYGAACVAVVLLFLLLVASVAVAGEPPLPDTAKALWDAGSLLAACWAGVWAGCILNH